MPNLIDAARLRTPDELALTPLLPRRILIVGSCLADDWARRLRGLPQPCEADLYLIGRELPAEPSLPIAEYDFQLVQIGLRFVLPDGAFSQLRQTDMAGHEKLFQHALNSLQTLLTDAMHWNRTHGILTFVFPFVTPSQNPVGRLMPRYDLRNPVYFIEKLNEALAQSLQSYTNAYFFDFNEILASFGKLFAQDDIYAAINHGAFMSNWDHKFDQNRLERAEKATDLFGPRVDLIFGATWRELVVMFRSIRQTDMVKLVVVDLDDTLWRGVTAELDLAKLPSSEGWPKGMWEALRFLKRRGVLLAIISKNDEERVRGFWSLMVGRLLNLDDFAMVRINWKPKPENMADILAHVNLLPRNVVYLDDNPTERAAIKAAYPEIRVLGGSPLAWRRVLLWSAETQVPEITAESAARTEMMRGQVTRETQRAMMSREEFLATLNVRAQLFPVKRMQDHRFPRVFELINKTNQFNTTGKRWTHEECAAAYAGGQIEFFTFEVADTYTEYGLVGVIVLEKNCISQFVMSCRVMGLGIEAGMVGKIGHILHKRGLGHMTAVVQETERNAPCRDIYERSGFQLKDGLWHCAAPGALRLPKHIKFGGMAPPKAELTKAAE